MTREELENDETEVCIDCGGANIEEGTCVDCEAKERDKGIKVAKILNLYTRSSQRKQAAVAALDYARQLDSKNNRMELLLLAKIRRLDRWVLFFNRKLWEVSL